MQPASALELEHEHGHKEPEERFPWRCSPVAAVWCRQHDRPGMRRDVPTTWGVRLHSTLSMTFASDGFCWVSSDGFCWVSSHHY
jgi:hypothetical protein